MPPLPYQQRTPWTLTNKYICNSTFTDYPVRIFPRAYDKEGEPERDEAHDADQVLDVVNVQVEREPPEMHRRALRRVGVVRAIQ